MRLKPQLDVVELIALAATVILSTLLNAQATTDTAWSSGSHPMAFDVASIRPSDSQVRANFGLSIDDTSIPPGGHLSANFSLKTYIEFAYKVMPTKEQEQSMLATSQIGSEWTITPLRRGRMVTPRRTKCV
jgi:hypothetical protein